MKKLLFVLLFIPSHFFGQCDTLPLTITHDGNVLDMCSEFKTHNYSVENIDNVVYCDSLGSGSTLYNSIVAGNSPTKTMYGQYRSLILEDENASFIFGTDNNVVTGDHFWVLSIERARYKESLFPGSLNLTLSGSNGSIQLTDNSNDVSVNTFIGSSRVFQLVSGSNGSAITGGGYVANSGSYGLVFPDLGTILLNPYAISQSINVAPSRSNNSEGFNNRGLYDAISLGASFSLNSQETITSDYIFVRARNSEFNYSENPTFISGSGVRKANSFTLQFCTSFFIIFNDLFVLYLIIYLLDLATLDATIGSVTGLAESLDTNYAAAYYPWVRIVDTDTNKYIWAPPSPPNLCVPPVLTPPPPPPA